MIEAFDHNGSRRRRVIAIGAATLLLLIQSFAAAHYHQNDSRRGLTQQTRVADSDALCAVCAFHFHSPTNPNAGPAMPGAVVTQYRVPTASAGDLVAAFVARAASRAPPLSV